MIGGGSKSPLMLFSQVNTGILVPHCLFMAEDSDDELAQNLLPERASAEMAAVQASHPGALTWHLKVWLCSLHIFGQGERVPRNILTLEGLG